MTTKLQVYNMALLNIKESKLASLTEGREARRVLDEFYDHELQLIMEAGFWKFALRSVKITSDPSTVPDFGPRYAFNKPNDWVRTYEVSGSEALQPPLEDWLEESNAILADVDPLYMRYVSNSDDGYGHDLDRWTARFVRAFSWALSASIAPKVTGASGDAMERIEEQRKKTLAEALAFEAMREPMKRPPQGRWNTGRFGGSRGRSDYYRFA